jgi:hypothetical protein
MRKNLSWILVIILIVSSCTSTDIAPEPDPVITNPPPTTGTPPTSNPPATNPPTTPPPATRPDFLPKFFDENPSCLLSKVSIETITIGSVTKTTNTYNYDEYKRFTQIKSTTEGVLGEAVTNYKYLDAEKKIEVNYTGFREEENYIAVATLNDDYTVQSISITKNDETSVSTYTYNANGEVVSQKFDSNLKSYEVEYTYGSKGIIKSERKNYVFKASPAPEKEDMVLEWSYGDATSTAYNSLVLSETNLTSPLDTWAS